MPSPALKIGTIRYSVSMRSAGADFVTGVSTVVTVTGVSRNASYATKREISPARRKKSALEVRTSRS